MKEDLISIIVPLYNESENINYLINELNNSFKDISGYQIELVFVDDGSVDDTIEKLKKIEFKNYSIQIIKLSKNCGSHAAFRAGLTKAKGNIITILAADLQDPPSLTIQLYEVLSKGYDIVWAQRRKTTLGFIEKFFSEFYSFLMRKLVLPNFPKKGFGLVMFNDKVKEELNKNIEGNSSILLQILGFGFKQSYIEYDKRERKIGKSKWTVSKKFKLLIDSFVGFSFAPIRFVSIIGVFFFLIGIFWSFYIIMRKLFYDDLAQGWPMLTSILLLGFGITNISLGILAEYLWRTLDTSRHRPVFIIDEVIESNKNL